MRIDREFDTALFDVDGTVLDTSEFVYQAFKHSLLVSLNMHVTWADLAPVLGGLL